MEDIPSGGLGATCEQLILFLQSRQHICLNDQHFTEKNFSQSFIFCLYKFIAQQILLYVLIVEHNNLLF